MNSKLSIVSTVSTEDDINTVMEIAQVSYITAVKVLEKHNNNINNACVELTEAKKSEYASEDYETLAYMLKKDVFIQNEVSNNPWMQYIDKVSIIVLRDYVTYVMLYLYDKSINDINEIIMKLSLLLYISKLHNDPNVKDTTYLYKNIVNEYYLIKLINNDEINGCMSRILPSHIFLTYKSLLKKHLYKIDLLNNNTSSAAAAAAYTNNDD
jgi:hypothetical protein